MDAKTPPNPPVVVTVAARNEEKDILTCLGALARTWRHAGPPAGGVVLCINNTTDDTASLAETSELAHLGLLRIHTLELPPALAHAGGARRAAGLQARAWLDKLGGGLMLFTDADSQPELDWVAQMRRALAEADLVCGPVRLPDDAFANRSAHVEALLQVEVEYTALVRRYLGLVDPDPLNPEPNHGCRSGANFGMTTQCWDVIGGIPALPVSEDRATVAAAEAEGLRVRLDDGPKVLTSARRTGRAPGGMADALAMQDTDPDPRLDEICESPQTLIARVTTRNRLRTDGPGNWLQDLGLSSHEIDGLRGLSWQKAWSEIFRLAPVFQQPRLTITTARAALPELREMVAQAQRSKT